ncbi:MAG: molybdopterin molybdotransferase MoeA [Rhodothalassiaceae bacterium]
MIPVAEARARMLSALTPTARQTVALEQAQGRVLAEPLPARRTQPPADFSAMDGYAFRSADAASGDVALSIVGESRAGHGFGRPLGHGEAVRIFTGAPLPEGADTVLIQEDARTGDGRLHFESTPAHGANVRPQGLDFRTGDMLLPAGTRLAPRHIALAAAADHARLKVHRRPRVALITTGDELTAPGAPRGPHAIVDALSPALAAFIAMRGGRIVLRARIADQAEALAAAVADLPACDLVLTVGGASVGDHDLVRPVLIAAGFRLDFWKIAMRPGKPLLFGDLHGTPLIGLPGNPVSALVTAHLFLGPVLSALSGVAAGAIGPHPYKGRLAAALPANGPREAYLRATSRRGKDGIPLLETAGREDSSLLSSFAVADSLIVRPPHAPKAEAGTIVEALALD